MLKRFVVLSSLLVLAAGATLAPAGAAAGSHHRSEWVCPAGHYSGTHCLSKVVTNRKGSPLATTAPSGYGPGQFRTAYGLSGDSTATVAIVDAYNDPNIKSDLDTYSRTFGLPVLPTCTSSTQTSCFQKVNQNGGTSYPRKDSGWALEISLDVEIAHGICPGCKILLVEAKTSSFGNLATAVNRAASMGADVISNSYGGSDINPSSYPAISGAYNHPGVAVTASSGDDGYGVESPASFNTVVAVGGTTLKLTSSNTRSSETAWSGAGSGCSAYSTARSWQTSLPNWGSTGCGNHRGVADVAADADPNTGAAVYDSVAYQGRSGWFKVGGTSLSAPLIGAVYALGGVSGSYPAQGTYAARSSLFDVTSGSNGTCTNTTMCRAGTGYDGPTGVGTPKGLTGF